MQKEIYNQKDFNYLVYTPKNFSTDKKYPLVLFLHGAGERGENLELLKNHSIPQICDKEANYESVIISPQCKAGRTWNSQTEKLHDFLERIVSEYNIDKNKISITGISMGGFGTWQMIMDYPKMFSSAGIICGGGMSWRIDTILNMPIRIFHGEKDEDVDCFYSKEIYEKLKKHGATNVELKLYPEFDHCVWNEVYYNTDLINWLIKQTNTRI